MEKTPLRADGNNLVFLRSTVSLLPLFAVCFLSFSGKASAGVAVSAGLSETPVFRSRMVKPSPQVSSKEPVLLTADEMDYDKETSEVTASGNVEITQGDSVILADFVLYNQSRNEVIAVGNVNVLESSGNVYFADQMELNDDLKKGVIAEFKARLSDNSLFAAAGAKKYDENYTELHNAVYSPCHICNQGKDGDNPLWQLRADRVLIDKEAQEVSYDDALMEIYGVPIFYTPYFSHPTPKADNKSGLLTPTFKQSTNLGSVYRQPYYYTISPDKDFTITPIVTTLEGPVFAGEYRQMFNNGQMKFDGSITQPQTRDAGGVNKKGQNYRGHFNAEGKFNIDETTDAGFDIRRTSDDTYLRRYDFSQDSLLTSRIYAEKHDFIKDGGRSLAGVQALQFYGLTASDNVRTAPFVLPLADFNWQSARRGYGDRFSLSGNLMSLTRDVGTQTRRISTTGGWKLPYITADGQVIEFESSVRADMYSVDDQTLPNGQNYNGQVGRVLPRATLTWHYPFINRMENANIQIEPVVMMSASPSGGNSGKIPNEDSQTPEFNTSNLFDPNRYAGYDRVQDGSQVSYGLRGQAQIYNDKYVDWLLGQNYHSATDASFPFAHDRTSHLSDYVGKVGLNYDPLTLTYRTRLDRESKSFNQKELDFAVNYYPVNLGANFLLLKNDPTSLNKKEVSGSAGLYLTKEWQVGMYTRRDLELGRITSKSANLVFQNDCIYVLNSIGKEYTIDRDIKPSMSYTFRVAFKNLD